MAERLGEALLDLEVNDAGFKRGVKGAERDARGLGRVLDDTARRAVALGKAMAIGAVAGGVTALGAGIAGAVKRLEDMRRLTAQVDRALANAGNSARTSAREIKAWADALESRTGRAADEVMAISANLASFGFGREQFFRAIALADDMAAAWGGDLRQNLEGLSRALDDPIGGMAMLSKRGIQLTDDQKSLAQAFLDTGDKASAQGVVFEALEGQVKGVAEAGFGGLARAMSQARKVWEAAFEDLVTGRGDAASLEAKLHDLIGVMSSPEMVAAAMSFGGLMVDTIKLIADTAVAAHGALRDLKDFFATDDAGLSDHFLTQELAALEKRYADAHAEVQALANGARRDELGVDMWNWQGRMDTIRAELDRREEARAKPMETPTSGPVTPPAGWRPGMDPAADKALEKQREAVKALIADLQHERDIVGENAREQQILNTIRNAGATVTAEQASEIRRLITETEDHREALEAQREAYQLLGNVALDSIDGMLDGSKSLADVLGDVAKMLQRAVLQAALLGQGPLSGLFGSAGTDGNVGGILGSIFSGFHAKGGLIPSGTFGIVGERGPEPVIGTSRGAMVLPNSTLAGMGGAKTEINVYNNAGVDVETQSTEDGQGGVRQDIILNRAVANAVARPGAANRAVRTAGRIMRR
ncbi:tape measure protein [Microcystis phage Mwe-Yong1]|nr:tape measure protein [Microcystis phage Mwe-Yong1]